MRSNNWSIAASYDTARIAVSYEFAGLGFGSFLGTGACIARRRASSGVSGASEIAFSCGIVIQPTLS